MNMQHLNSSPIQTRFREEFSDVASTIIKSNRFIYHAREICANEQNYFGLFAIDVAQKNRSGQYRKDGVTPDLNHQAHIFFQLQGFHENDKQNTNRDYKYLPNKPYLDKALAWLHDEGEDTDGLTKEKLSEDLNQFLNNINAYIERHNEYYPELHLQYPSQEQISKMHSEIPDLIKPFDIITKNYKGNPNLKNYYDYHKDLLGEKNISGKEQEWHARACRLKFIDKSVNAAALSYRSEVILSHKNYEIELSKYREWVMSQINQMRDIYFDQNFSLSHTFNALKDSGFTGAAIQKFPNSAAMMRVMKNVMELQLTLYSNNIANERGKQGSPLPNTYYPVYHDIALSPRVDILINTINRLKETARIDALGENHPKEKGIFNIPFHTQKPPHQPIPLNMINAIPSPI